MTTTIRVCPFCRADLRHHCPSPSCPWWKCRICLTGPINFDIPRALKNAQPVDWPHTQPDIQPGEE